MCLTRPFEAEVRDAETVSVGMVVDTAHVLHGGDRASPGGHAVGERSAGEDSCVFLENCGLIEKVLADRRKRYAYPPAYSRAQAFATVAGIQ